MMKSYNFEKYGGNVYVTSYVGCHFRIIIIIRIINGLKFEIIVISIKKKQFLSCYDENID